MSVSRGTIYPFRTFRKVLAREACRFVRVDALDPFFKTFEAYADVVIPALLAFAVKAPGLLMASPIQSSFPLRLAIIHLFQETDCRIPYPSC